MFHADEGVDKTLANLVKIREGDVGFVKLTIPISLPEDVADERFNFSGAGFIEGAAGGFAGVGKADDGHLLVLRGLSGISELGFEDRGTVFPTLLEGLVIEELDQSVSMVLIDRVADGSAEAVFAFLTGTL